MSSSVENSDHDSSNPITGRTGERVVVTCNDGYDGGGRVVCRADGSFSTVSCRPSACAPTSVANSESSDSAIRGFTGDSVTVTCNPGYSGSGAAVCGTDGSFSIVTCEADSCMSSSVENSDRDSSNPITGRTGESVVVTCNDGYDGGGRVVCRADGSFSTVSCRANARAPTSVANSDMSSGQRNSRLHR